VPGRGEGVAQYAVGDAAGVPTDLVSRNPRIREMATRGVAWPEIARAFGMSPTGVRFVWRDLPPRKAGCP
jgi:hypothetical protein